METPENNHHSKGRNLRIAVIVLVASLGLIAAYWYFFMRGIVSSDDARIGGEMVDLAPQISGTLTRVTVHEGDHVQKGQVVFSLYREAFQADLAKAEAALAQLETALQIAHTQFEKAMHGPRAEEIKIMETAKEKAEVEAKFAEASYLRTKTLYSKNLASKETLEQVQTNWEIARHTFDEANNRLQLLLAGTRKEDLILAEENVTLVRRQKATAEVTVQQAKLNLELTEVKAPFAGIVVRRWQDPGNVATAGRSVVTLFNPANIYIDANIEEKYLNQIALGDKVDISVDAFPQLSLTGKVSTILPVANSEFSLIPSEGVSGTFIKVSQRLPVRIIIDALPDFMLGPGLSVEVKIYHNPLHSESKKHKQDESSN